MVRLGDFRERLVREIKTLLRLHSGRTWAPVHPISQHLSDNESANTIGLQDSRPRALCRLSVSPYPLPSFFSVLTCATLLIRNCIPNFHPLTFNAIFFKLASSVILESRFFSVEFAACWNCHRYRIGTGLELDPNLNVKCVSDTCFMIHDSTVCESQILTHSFSSYTLLVIIHIILVPVLIHTYSNIHRIFICICEFGLDLRSWVF
jgi:hypothetical protein